MCCSVSALSLAQHSFLLPRFMAFSLPLLSTYIILSCHLKAVLCRLFSGTGYDMGIGELWTGGTGFFPDTVFISIMEAPFFSILFVLSS